MPTTTRIVRIGNSRGIRVPKVLLELAALPPDVELQAEPGRLVVTPAHGPRAAWNEAAKEMRSAADDRLIDAPHANRFDDQEWDW